MSENWSESSEVAQPEQRKGMGRAVPLAIAGVGLAGVVAASWFVIKKRRAAKADSDREAALEEAVELAA